ncbi:hypothetical protein [Magnetococcus marinus]|nr:hypothetical protein [Magnetococcus marinus]
MGTSLLMVATVAGSLIIGLFAVAMTGVLLRILLGGGEEHV